MKIIYFILFNLLLFACSHTPAVEVSGYECTAAREYITTANYLNDEKRSKRNPGEINTIAMQVAKGCDGAARRYIKIRDLLLDANLSGDVAHRHALAFALASDVSAEAFMDIFALTYERNGLDLSGQDSLRLALRLSVEYKGDPSIAGFEFVTLTKYCVAVESLNLPRPMCARLAEKQMIAAESHRLAFADDMIALIEFLRDEEDGPRMTTKDAVDLASKLISVSPFSGPNFIRIYEYATSSGKVKLNRDQTIELARDVAMLSKSPTLVTTQN